MRNLRCVAEASHGLPSPDTLVMSYADQARWFPGSHCKNRAIQAKDGIRAKDGPTFCLFIIVCFSPLLCGILRGLHRVGSRGDTFFHNVVQISTMHQMCHTSGVKLTSCGLDRFPGLPVRVWIWCTYFHSCSSVVRSSSL